MVKIAIRDDDTSFFTSAHDLVTVYSELGNFPISYAVVPFMLTNSYSGGNCPELKGNTESRWVGENLELVEMFRRLIEERQVEILLHGYTHEYHKVNEKVLPEFKWRSLNDCRDVIKKGKIHLEDVFGQKINWFVSPSNMINRDNIHAITENGLNYSGIIQSSFDRPFNIKSLKNYCFRFANRLSHSFGYPGVLDYGTHKEVYACPIVEGDYLYNMYKYCKQNSLPMVINSHYWDIRDNANSRKILFDFVKYALKDGAKPCLISDVL